MPSSQACALVLSHCPWVGGGTIRKYWIGKVPVLSLACQRAIIFSSIKQDQCALLIHLPSTSLLEPV